MHQKGAVLIERLPLCPICGADSDVLRDLSADSIQSGLIDYYGPTMKPVETLDYRILRCRSCTLEFADPMEPGTAGFYEELGQQAEYYPKDRWEWDRVISEITSRDVQTILEIGCGSGSFMQKLQAVPGCSITGIDINPRGIDECRAKGLQAFCETAEEHLQRTGTQYDCTVAFHCLEHVSSPLAFAKTCLSLTKANGIMCFSTPFSPMSFEDYWYDPLNNPPHHMTRWNSLSYNVLAQNLGLQCQLASPNAGSALRRAAMSVALYKYRSPVHLTKAAISKSVLLHPAMFVRNFFRQIQRERLDGRAAGDVVLVIFSGHM